MSNYLMVPIRLDALYVRSEKAIVEQVADFSKLPFFNGKADINPDTANLSESIASKPFQNENLRLGMGIHLHWSLPDALTQGKDTGEDLIFPSVPNRWLVTRSKKNTSNQWEVEKQWVVESDYLYPEDEDEDIISVNIPYRLEDAGTHQTHRYLGRKLLLEDWPDNSPQAEYLHPLTVVGYGDPDFAAFYPNCYSVFGMHDPVAGSIAQFAQYRYELIGWYSDSGQDELAKFAAPLTQDFKDAIKDNFQWEMDVDQKPDAMLCYARLDFNPSDDIENTHKNAPTTITVANSGTESLSAHLSKLIDTDNRVFIENQLEAFQVNHQLEQDQVDTIARLKAIRHEKEFHSEESGIYWEIKAESNTPSSVNEGVDTVAQVNLLPDGIVANLNEVNTLQRTYDLTRHEIESLRKQLFADWYKYMLCCYPPDRFKDDYPDIDLVKTFIEEKVLKVLENKIRALGVLSFQRNGLTGEVIAVTTTSNESTIAYQFTAKISQLLNDISKFNKALPPTAPGYSLKEVAAPRYWQPNDPVVLINGDAVEPTRRHGQDGLLSCRLYTTASIPLSTNDFANILAEINNLYSNDPDSWGFQTWEKQPWNPYLLEWQAQLFPIANKSNLGDRRGSYDPAFITDNYEARFNDPDLSIRPGQELTTTNVANTYTNRSILTPYTKQYLSENLEIFLKQKILENYFSDHDDERADDFLSKTSDNIDKLKAWYEERASLSVKSDEEKAKDAVYTAIRAYKELQALNCLSQSLGGFNEALLMHSQTFELPINDPLAFDNYLPFTQSEVNQAITASLTMAPSPLNDFNPIRSGRLSVTRLRLVDTFGQVKDLSIENINTPVKMTVPDSQRLVYLPPRLPQPARIHFRWLNAQAQTEEMNTHSKTRPICGWIAPNYFDRSLMIYDARGKPLGAINRNADWESPPGVTYPDLIENIANPHLQKMVAYLRNTGKSNNAFLNNFINALDSALENIEPASYQENKSIALMMGRPIALVRAALNIELQGLPAVNQDWSVLRRDMNAHNREHDNFTKVKFPVRLGEYRQLNDGLVGYWIESEDGSYSENFYAPQADRDDSNNIDGYLDRNPINFYQSIDEAPQIFSILMDVQGVAHATAGILPSKAITIPPEQYKEALQDIEVTFLTAPILTERNKVNLSLAPQHGYDWHWISKKDNLFWDEELSTVPTLRQSIFIEQSSRDDATLLWNYLIQVQWLKSIDDELATIVPKDQRSSMTLEYPFIGLEDEVETLFDVFAEYIRPTSTEASFGSAYQAREGWVKLSKREVANESSR